MPETPAEEPPEDNGYYHYHMRMTAEMCFTINTELVNANILNNAFYQEPRPEPTKHAYQQLLATMLGDPRTRRRLLATMLLEKAWQLYYNEEDILEDLAPEEGLVTEGTNALSWRILSGHILSLERPIIGGKIPKQAHGHCKKARLKEDWTPNPCMRPSMINSATFALKRSSRTMKNPVTNGNTCLIEKT